MKKLLAATVFVAALVFVSTSLASVPTRAHIRQYLLAYKFVQQKFGERAPGCNLVRKRGSCHHRATDRDVVSSYATLQQMLTPRLTVRVGSSVAHLGYNATLDYPASSLARCIIQAESSGNPLAVNGKYMGIGQWEKSRWLSDGGGRYAPTPLGATYSQQVAILNGEGPVGMAQQQGQYDRCS